MTTVTLQSVIHVLEKAKWAFTTRRVCAGDADQLIYDIERSRPGDLLLAQVESIGQHSNIRLSSARQSALYEGDYVVVSIGARYAPDQFEATATISTEGCHLVAAGGVAGTVRQQHQKMKRPTVLKPMGLLANANAQVLNLNQYALSTQLHSISIPLIAGLGTSMNSGKTTTVANIVHGLSRAGWKVGTAKLTGTGAPGDLSAYSDAGAYKVLDFTDAGYATTYQLDLTQLEQIFFDLCGHLQQAGCDIIVAEVADGLLQKETAALIRSPVFRQHANNTVFAATDALSAIAGVKMLQECWLPVAGVSGLITCSPLACQEVSLQAMLPILNSNDLQSLAQSGQLINEVPNYSAEWMAKTPAMVPADVLNFAQA